MAFKMKGYNSPLNKENKLPPDFYEKVEANRTNKVGASINMLHSKSASLKNGKTTLVYNAK